MLRALSRPRLVELIELEDHLFTWLESPVLYVGYMIETWSDFWLYYTGAFTFSAIGFVLMMRLGWPRMSVAFLAGSLGPGTWVCGSWTAVPWTMAWLGLPDCANIATQTMCLSLNLAVVALFAAAWRTLGWFASGA